MYRTAAHVPDGFVLLRDQGCKRHTSVRHVGASQCLALASCSKRHDPGRLQLQLSARAACSSYLIMQQ